MTQPMASPQQDRHGSPPSSDAAAAVPDSSAATQVSKASLGGGGGDSAPARSMSNTRSLLSMSYGDLLPPR
jgi:hypothetical protein